MRGIAFTSILLALAVFTAACDRSGDTSVDSPDEPIAQPPDRDDDAADGNDADDSDQRPGGLPKLRPYPPFTANIIVMESMPPQYAAMISVTAPTGGWELTLDRAELTNGILRAYVTLEKPARDEIVTQALVKHTERYSAGMDEIASVEVYVKRLQRGEEEENRKAEYRLEVREP